MDCLIDNFLADTSGFHEVSLKGLIPERALSDKGRLDLLGPEVKGDGVFAVRLEKKYV